MTGEADLGGHRILVVEDEYYLATDAAHALRGVGATVLGPCRTEAAARAEIETAAPTGAVIDINLGTGPSFTLARMLRERGIPFVFMTGYEEDVIPVEFAGITRLQKPIEPRKMLRTLARALDAAP